MSEQTTDLEVRESEDILHPLTGELVRSDDLPAVAAAIDALRVYRNQINEAIHAFTAAAVAESRRLGTKTITAGALTLEISADSEVEWDLDVLARLRALGLPDDRYEALVRPTVTYKVDGRVARQLEGASDTYAEVIQRARIRIPKQQYVRIK